MGRAEAGSTKAMGNAIKAKGLGRLRWYCQICEKQCRDENGFQAHCRSEPHLRKMMAVGPKAGQTIAEFSRQFQYEFVSLLRTAHNTKRVRANTVYNEYIQDKHHVHMNATRWVTLSGFIMTLGKAGIVKVDEDDKGLWITWIDNSPKTLAKHAAAQKKERATMDGEDRERKMLQDQIDRARAAQEDDDKAAAAAGLQKAEGEKITLNLFGGNNAEAGGSGSSNASPQAEAGLASAAPATTIAATPAAASISFGSFGSFGSTPPSTSVSAPPVSISNPLKRPAPTNVFKSASSKTAKTDSDAGRSVASGGNKSFMSESERLMKEDLARKASRANQGYTGAGPRRGGR